MTAPTVHLGYAVGTGEPVAVPLKHLAVTGQTQESGKTTTLEALAARSGRPVIAFVTKRGESSFAGGRRLAPYFRDRADWQFVDQLLEAQLREKNKFLRPWLIRICRTTRTLADVHQAVKTALKKAKGLNEGVYTQLDAYLDLIVPEIGRARLAPSIDLAAGLNVMDVGDYPAPMQMLFVQSAIDWINEREKGVTVIVPEAWEFIPEGKGSPVKASAVGLVRKGAGLGNFIWVDSQDMAGVDKVILRGCSVWLIGAQREANEIKRNLANIPAGIQRPRPADIARLGRGEFFACWKDTTQKVYVQPAWMDPGVAQAVAQGVMDPATARGHSPPPTPEPKAPVMAEQPIDTSRLARELAQLLQGTQYAKLPEAVVHSATPAGPGVPAAPPTSLSGQEEALYQLFKARLIDEAPAVLRLLVDRPEIQVKVERRVIEAAGDSLQGRLALLIRGGWFDEGQTGYAAWKELVRLGSNPAKVSVYTELKNLAKLGFVTKEGVDGKEQYKAVPAMKANVKAA